MFATSSYGSVRSAENRAFDEPRLVICQTHARFHDGQ